MEQMNNKTGSAAIPGEIIKREKRKTFLKRAGAIVIALAVWQIAAMTIHQEILLVTPVQVGRRLLTIWQTDGFFSSIWFTFYHIAGGFFLGLAFGVLLGFLAARFPLAETLLWPWMAVIKSVPVASFVVICLIWLSSRNLSVFISFLIVMPIIYQNTLTGLKNLDPGMIQMAKIFRLKAPARLRYITIPGIKSYLISACEVTTGMAWKAGVAAEVIGIPQGSIGKALYNAKIWVDTDDLLAWTVVIVVISVVTEKIFMKVLRRVLK